MKSLQQIRFGVGLNPIDTTGATTNGTSFDLATLPPSSELACIVQTGNVAANVTTLKLQHSDDDSSWADLTGGGFTAPTAASGDNKIYVAYVAPGGTLRRYVRVTVTGGAGATLIGAVWLSIAGQAPSTTTERGAAETLNIAV